jgi:hypothetical protein
MEAQKKGMSNVMVPPPQQNAPVMVVGTQKSAAARNPLSALLGMFPIVYLLWRMGWWK